MEFKEPNEEFHKGNDLLALLKVNNDKASQSTTNCGQRGNSEAICHASLATWAWFPKTHVKVGGNGVVLWSPHRWHEVDTSPHTSYRCTCTHTQNHKLPATVPIKKNNDQKKKKEIDCNLIVKNCHNLMISLHVNNNKNWFIKYIKIQFGIKSQRDIRNNMCNTSKQVRGVRHDGSHPVS